MEPERVARLTGAADPLLFAWRYDPDERFRRVPTARYRRLLVAHPCS